MVDALKKTYAEAKDCHGKDVLSNSAGQFQRNPLLQVKNTTAVG